ncbi:CCHC-type domain-containing protein [Trichonephila clavipes]|nr:CCHC-type domain-containing protein [Trichonephila clavipes]
MYKDTKNFVRSCTVCLSRKNAFKIPPAPHQPVEQSQEPGETCHIDIFGPLKTTPKGKSYDGPERVKWNDSEKRSFNGSWGKQPFGEKNYTRAFGDGPRNFKVSTEGIELEDGTVAARVDLLGKVIPRRAIEDKLSKLVKTSISVDGKLVHALVDSGTEITVIKKDLVPGISVEGASTIYLTGIFGPAIKCPLVYVPIGLATGGPDVLDKLGGAQSEENSLAQSSQDLRVDSGNVDETKVSMGILPEREHRRILKRILLHVGMKWEHWVLRMRR